MNVLLSIIFIPDINDCASDPCGVLFKCIDSVASYECHVIASQLVAILLALMASAIAATVSALLLRKRNQTKQKELDEWYSALF